MHEMVLEQLIPKARQTAIIAQIERITQPVTDFIRGNPIVSTAAIGIGTTGLITGISAITRRKKKKKVTKRKVSRRARPKKRKKKTKAQIKRQRLRNLAKARKARGKGRRIIKGGGLGRGEIKHSGRGTRGTKLVSFRTSSGKIVRFKTKGTSKRRRGFRK